MNEQKKQIVPVYTIVLFVLAFGLLLMSTIGAARAVPEILSDDFDSEFSMQHIGITLNENGNPVSKRDYSNGTWKESTGELLKNMLAEGEALVPGKPYDEALTVTNSGVIDEYVRVTVYKYWVDTEKSGDKERTLSPDLIQLNLTGNGWVVDKKYSGTVKTDKYAERTVLYYTKPLAVGDTSPALSDTLSIDGKIATKVKQQKETKNGLTTIKTTYAYDGMQFVLEAEADGVQTHHAEDAILSAWGREVSISGGGALSLK